MSTVQEILNGVVVGSTTRLGVIPYSSSSSTVFGSSGSPTYTQLSGSNINDVIALREDSGYTLVTAGSYLDTALLDLQNGRRFTVFTTQEAVFTNLATLKLYTTAGGYLNVDSAVLASASAGNRSATIDVSAPQGILRWTNSDASDRNIKLFIYKHRR